MTVKQQTSHHHSPG